MADGMAGLHRCKHGNTWGICKLCNGPTSLPVALQILKEAADSIQTKSILRDSSGTRSMGRTVRAFNELTGNNLSEEDGYMFMVCVKASRAYSGLDPDNYVDGSAYFALAGEAHGQRNSD